MEEIHHITRLANCIIGEFNNSSQFMKIKHKKKYKNYALLQRDDGYTYINASSGKQIALRINNSSKCFVMVNEQTGNRSQRYFSKDTQSNYGTFSLGFVSFKVNGTCWVNNALTS